MDDQRHARLERLFGRRVTARSRVPGERGPSGGPAHTDVVGRIVALDATTVVIERRDGTEARLVTADLVALKEVPDGPARRRTRPARDHSPEQLARICTHGWPPLVAEPLGDWTLRAAGGFTGRANSVAVHGDPGVGFTAALAAVEDFYRSHGLPPRAQVIDDTPAARAFAEAGWTGIGGTHDHAVVQVADAATVLAAASAPGAGGPDRTTGAAPELDGGLDDAWLALLERDLDAYPREAVEHVVASPRTLALARVGTAGSRDGALDAITRMVVTGEWAGLSCVSVRPEARRSGLASLLLEECTRWAVERGADKVYLQTMLHNAPALSLYARYGFVTHHTYRYLAPPNR
ncbi:ribosomal protein S18 acetylase RimI-like enzyme [Mumia flava]|uniref:Ribosomal protein S18 acetylase RimI-like enzyme n=1 Tax=Mumia flava TaxID=1348852 RepID=A0A2M9BFK0_9ACTN|nr:GNAT family N-acetyltransferase [Mumia flava]PJJ56727.1 ribosomal protein S18 acetylase RimI-like enzyme [Mumia flava]